MEGKNKRIVEGLEAFNGAFKEWVESGRGGEVKSWQGTNDTWDERGDFLRGGS